MQRLPRIVLGLYARLPLSFLHGLGTVLGWVIYGISPTYRRHLRENMEHAGYRDASLRRAAIAQAGSLSGAARALGAPVASVSRKLAALEKGISFRGLGLRLTRQ